VLKRFRPILKVFLLCCAVAAAKELPFPVDEKLTYKISWNGIPVAWSVATTEMVRENGTDYIAVKVETRTYPVFNVFYKVEDTHECLLDLKTLLPVRFTKNMMEGSSRYSDVTTFDYTAGTARFENLVTGTVTNVSIGQDTRDYLSFMYFMRGREMKPGTTTKHEVLADDRVYEVLVHSEKIEDVELSHYSAVPSLRIDPEAAFNGLFVRAGKATLWVSRDLRRILTRAKARVPFGRITVKLTDVSGAGDDFWITEKKGDDDED
jgi:hypothetical protein